MSLGSAAEEISKSDELWGNSSFKALGLVRSKSKLLIAGRNDKLVREVR